MASTATLKTPTNTTTATRQATRDITRTATELHGKAHWLLREQEIADSSPDPQIANQRLLASRALQIAELQDRCDAQEAERHLRDASQTMQRRMNPPWAPRIVALMQEWPDRASWTADEIRAALDAPYPLTKPLRDMMTKGALIATGDRFSLPEIAASAKPAATTRARSRKAAA